MKQVEEPDFQVKGLQHERIPDERKARQAPERQEKGRNEEVLKRRVDEFKRSGATHSKVFGRP